MFLSGFVLSGGASRRMGEPKASLPVGDSTLIEQSLRHLRPYVGWLSVVGQAEQAPQLSRLSVDRILTDYAPGSGPLMGIYTALMHTETEWNLILPCDMPWVSQALLDGLLAAAHPDFHAVAGRHPEKGIQPFPLLCHVEAARAAGALLDRGERSLQAFLRAVRTHWVPIRDSALWRAYRNVNTPSDYEQLTHEEPLAF